MKPKRAVLLTCVLALSVLCLLPGCSIFSGGGGTGDSGLPVALEKLVLQYGSQLDFGSGSSSVVSPTAVKGKEAFHEGTITAVQFLIIATMPDVQKACETQVVAELLIKGVNAMACPVMKAGLLVGNWNLIVLKRTDNGYIGWVYAAEKTIGGVVVHVGPTTADVEVPPATAVPAESAAAAAA